MYLTAAIAIITIMVIALIRALRGPSLFDRILAVNMFGTNTVLLVALIGILSGQSSFLDIAIVYALINFITVIAVLRFFEYGKEKKKAEAE